MLEVIRVTKPTWVIAENVRGLLTWEQGLVVEQICADLEALDYEVQPLIIPAVAVNAPHRRDRIWFIGHAKHDGLDGTENRKSGNKRSDGDKKRPNEVRQPQGTNPVWFDTKNWDKDWMEVAAQLCGLDDGLPVELDGFKLTKAQNRAQQLKAYGNSIVPQVAIEIMKSLDF